MTRVNPSGPVRSDLPEKQNHAFVDFLALPHSLARAVYSAADARVSTNWADTASLLATYASNFQNEVGFVLSECPTEQ
jgi:hypothetical protein